MTEGMGGSASQSKAARHLQTYGGNYRRLAR
jgi:hypothetical protein